VEEKFESPDGAIVALVRFTKTVEATTESRVELRTHSGRVLSKHDYGSDDGEHGYGVTKAVWTLDSQFFVYSLESSGGQAVTQRGIRPFSSSHATGRRS